MILWHSKNNHLQHALLLQINLALQLPEKVWSRKFTHHDNNVHQSCPKIRDYYYTRC